MKVALLPFNGPEKQANKAMSEIVRTLKRNVDFVPLADWDDAAKRLVAPSRSPDDLAAVAKDLGVAVVITGTVKRDGDWMLQVSVRNGDTGKSVDKLRYPLKGPRVDAATLRQLADEIAPAVDRAAAPPSTEGTEAAGEKRNIEDENPLAPKPPETPATAERPPWTPYVDADVGMVISSRNFAFDSGGLKNRGGAAAGLHFDATGYPLALLANRPGDTINALTGLGVGVTLDWMFWPDEIPCTDTGGGNCTPTSDRVSAREYRVETGLRYHWNFLNRPMSPDLLVSFQYGLHAFSIAKKADGTDVGPPDVAYSYLTIGLGTRVPISRWIAVLFNFNFHGVLDTGAIQTQAEYGPGGAYGIRLALGAESNPWRGLTLRVSGFYERFGLSFNGSGTPAPAKTANGGAADQYYGAIITAGWVF